MFRRSVYLNYAGVAPISLRTIWELLRYLLHFYFLGPRSALLKYDKYNELLASEVSRFIGCEPSEVSFIKNTTEGIIIASESLPLSEGDEILVMSHEYPANLIPWMKKRQDGISVQVIEGRNPLESFQRLVQSIGTRTRAIAISWVQYWDGLQVDLRTLSKICKEKGIFLVVDGVQIAGTREINFKELDIDIFVCGGHKHLQAGPGSGFLVVRKDLLPRLKPFKVGIRSVKRFDTEGFELKQTAFRFEEGTLNLPGIISLLARLRRINQIGMKFIETRSKMLLEHYKSILYSNGIDLISYPNQGNLISIRVDQAIDVVAFMEKHRIYIRKISEKLIRVSFSIDNRESDIQAFVKVYKKYLKKAKQSETLVELKSNVKAA